MSKIKVMDSRLANMIAAGEVVERPSSVIKELVENSIDANAKHIEVRIEQAGRKKIVVKDDGAGMDKDDAVLCFTRHASSKLVDEYQLFRIKTMGFRGEALPSIASVSKVTLYTSSASDEIGSKVVASESGVERTDYKAIKGSIFEVEELFYNTPVRLKYLKSDYTEVSSCLDVMQRLALAYPSISFDFYVDDKLSFSTTGRGDLLEVIARLYGNDTAKKMIPISFDSLEYKVTGYISKPDLTRASRYYMITILNNRNVYLPKVQKALIDAYKDYLFSSQFPFVVLHIDVEPGLVDVNVHPSKKEVRLSSEDILIDLVYQGVKDKLREGTRLHDALLTPKKEVETAPLFETPKSEEQFVRPVKQNIREEKLIFKEDEEEKVEFKKVEPIEEAQVEEQETKSASKVIPNWRVVGQIHKTYIVYEGDDGFYIMDQHAAMERINYEKFQKLYNSHYDIVEPLIPITIDLSLSDMRHLNQEKREDLKRIGIVIEDFGPCTIRIVSYPVFLNEKNMLDSYLHSIIEDVITKSRVDIKELRRNVIASMACRASLKANLELNEIEMESLYMRLFECENPSCCPHGRPTIIHFSKYDIEKLFKRVGV